VLKGTCVDPTEALNVIPAGSNCGGAPDFAVNLKTARDGSGACGENPIRFRNFCRHLAEMWFTR
jgi:hypothetical protein